MQMKNESFKETLKYLDKKTLRKICVSFKKQIEDKEVEIFNLKEYAEKQKEDLKNRIIEETPRADSKELLSESIERVLEKVAKVDKIEGLNYEEYNIKKSVSEKL